MEDQFQLRIIEDQFKSLLLATKREGTEDLFLAMQQNGFFKASCRLHHNFEGGAAWYSMEVLLRMVKKDSYVLPLDSIIIVALLHELYRIDGGGDATIPGARALAMLTKLCPQFKLRKTEYDALLWYNYTLQQLGHMGEDAKDALSNALRQSLRSAKLFSIHHPKDWEALESAMQGKRRPRRDVVFESGHAYSSAPRIRHTSPNDYCGLNQEQGLTQRPPRVPSPRPVTDESLFSNMSIADMAKVMRQKIQRMGVTSEEAFLIRDLVRVLPVNRYDVYLDGVDDSIKIAINAELDRACKMKRGSKELARIFLDEKNAKILDRNYNYKELYRRLQNGYGQKPNFEDNTLQKVFGDLEVRIQ